MLYLLMTIMECMNLLDKLIKLEILRAQILYVLLVNFFYFFLSVWKRHILLISDLLGDWCLFEYLLFCFFRNRKACWRRRRELCFMAFLHSNRCRSKSCFLVGFTKKYSFGWSFWCCFWVIYYQCPCKGTWNCILQFICCLRYFFSFFFTPWFSNSLNLVIFYGL